MPTLRLDRAPTRPSPTSRTALLTTATAAELTQVPLAQFRRWQTGQDGPPAVRMAGCYFYRLPPLTAWLSRWWRPSEPLPATHGRPWWIVSVRGS